MGSRVRVPPRSPSIINILRQIQILIASQIKSNWEAVGKAGLVFLAIACVVIAIIWPPRCEGSGYFAIGNVLELAGCSRC
jgi:hypothetical protein